MQITKMLPSARITKSRVQMLMHYPFFGMLALHLTPVEMGTDEEKVDCPTASTDGRRLYYNPDFIDKLSDQELNFVLVHEVLHPALGHLWRLGNRNRKKWNYAADYAINLMITETNNNDFALPNDVLYDKKYTGMFAEEIYELLPDPDKLSKHGTGNVSSHDKWGADPDSSSTDDVEWQNRVIAAAQSASGRGNLPSGINRMIKNIMHPRKNWHDVLADFVAHEIHDYSFSPTDRRFIYQDLLLPDFGEEIEVIKDLVVAVDGSGSINDSKLALFFSEIIGLIDQFGGITGHLLYFDADVAAEYSLEEPNTWEPKGGGGTDFRPIFKYIEKKEWNCSGCVIITDLDGWMPEGNDIPTQYPVLWVCDDERSRNHDEEVPFGQLTYID